MCFHRNCIHSVENHNHCWCVVVIRHYRSPVVSDPQSIVNCQWKLPQSYKMIAGTPKDLRWKRLFYIFHRMSGFELGNWRLCLNALRYLGICIPTHICVPMSINLIDAGKCWNRIGIKSMTICRESQCVCDRASCVPIVHTWLLNDWTCVECLHLHYYLIGNSDTNAFQLLPHMFCYIHIDTARCSLIAYIYAPIVYFNNSK